MGRAVAPFQAHAHVFPRGRVLDGVAEQVRQNAFQNGRVSPRPHLAVGGFHGNNPCGGVGADQREGGMGQRDKVARLAADLHPAGFELRDVQQRGDHLGEAIGQAARFVQKPGALLVQRPADDPIQQFEEPDDGGQRRLQVVHDHVHQVVPGRFGFLQSGIIGLRFVPGLAELILRALTFRGIADQEDGAALVLQKAGDDLDRETGAVFAAGFRRTDVEAQTVELVANLAAAGLFAPVPVEPVRLEVQDLLGFVAEHILDAGVAHGNGAVGAHHHKDVGRDAAEDGAQIPFVRDRPPPVAVADPEQDEEIEIERVLEPVQDRDAAGDRRHRVRTPGEQHAHAKRRDDQDDGAREPQGDRVPAAAVEERGLGSAVRRHGGSVRRGAPARSSFPADRQGGGDDGGGHQRHLGGLGDMQLEIV
jgi:hypothetical protein